MRMRTSADVEVKPGPRAADRYSATGRSALTLNVKLRSLDREKMLGVGVPSSQLLSTLLTTSL